MLWELQGLAPAAGAGCLVRDHLQTGACRPLCASHLDFHMQPCSASVKSVSHAICHLGSNVAVTPSHSPLTLAANASHELAVDASSSDDLTANLCDVADLAVEHVCLSIRFVKREVLLLTNCRNLAGSRDPVCQGLTPGPFGTLTLHEKP